MHDIAVVTVNYKMKDYIREALTSLFSDMKNTPFSVLPVVVDNGSGDGVGKMLAEEFPGTLFLQNGKNIGFGAANNNAVRAVRAKYYLFLNPDSKFTEPGTLSRLHRFMEENPAVGMCAPRLVNPQDGTLQLSCCRFPTVMTPFYRRTALGQLESKARQVNKFLMRDWEHDRRRMVDWVIGSAMFVRASAVEKVGLFDERFFMYFEDTDWCRRFWLNHLPIYYLPEISLAHEHRRSSAEQSVWSGFFKNKTTRYHVLSWMKYIVKYRLKIF
jgi:GT2 family glycosyltransferase